MRAVFAALLVLSLASPALAVVRTGRIQGVVNDEEGKPLPGVTVTVKSPELPGGPKVDTTDAEGRFRFIELPPGTYEVTVEKQGFRSQRREKLDVQIAQTVTLYLTMDLPVGEESIEVTAERPVVDVEKQHSGQTMNEQFMERLPIFRQYQDISGLVAGVRPGDGNPNVRGSLSSSNQFLLDGINVTDPVTGTFSANFNFDAIKNVEIITGTPDAEYGYSSGGIINVVTKRGGNEFELETGLYYQDPSFLASDPDEDLSFRDVEFSLEASGPFIKDEMWWYSNYSFTLSTQTPTPVPSILEAFGEGFTAPPTREFMQNSFMGKVNWQVTQDAELEFSLSAQAANIENDDFSNYVHPEATSRQLQASFFNGIRYKQVFGESVVWDTQFGATALMIDSGPSDGDLTSVAHSSSTTGHEWGNALYDYNDWRFRGNVLSKLTYFMDDFFGNHEFKAGAEFTYGATSSTFWYTGQPEGGAEAGCESADCAAQYRVDRGSPQNPQPNYIVYMFEPLETYLFGNMAAVFVQDAWKPIQDVTIYPGLRFDYSRLFNWDGKVLHPYDVDQPLPDDAIGNICRSGDIEIEGCYINEGPIIELASIVPRFRANWDITSDGKTVITAGYARVAELGVLGIADFISREANTRLYFYNGLTNRYDSQGRFRNVGTLADTDMVPPTSNEFIAGIQRELFPDVGLEVEFIYKTYENLFEDTEDNLIWNEDGTNVIGSRNGLGNDLVVLRTPNDAFRRYTAMEATLHKKFSDDWEVLASYTLSRTVGTVNSFISTALDNPKQFPFAFGPAPDDVTHQVKLLAQVGFGYGIWLSPIVELISGEPYSRLFFNDYDGGYSNRKAPRGIDPFTGQELRYPMLLETSATLGWDLYELTGYRFEVVGYFRNLLNMRTPVAIEQRNFPESSTTQFGETLARLSPFRASLGLRYKF